MTAERLKPSRVAVLDVGKTNAKAVLLDGGEECFARTAPNSVVQDGPYPHFDIPRLQAFFLDALADMAKRHGGFDAISVTAHGASGALMKGADLALPVLDYEYAGPDELAAAYDRVRPPFSESFSPRLPGGLNLGAQLFWQERRFPDRFAEATHFVTYPQFWSAWLTGVPATEPTSLGTHTDLWRPREGDFSSLVETMGWRRKMAPLHSAFARLGPLRAELASRMGIDHPVTVACGIHDSNASLLPHLQAEQGRFSVVSTGTWVVAFAVGGSVDRLDASRDTLANVDAWGRPVPAARFMGGREFDILSGSHHVQPSAATIEAVLEAGIMALPSFAPGTGPFPDAIGRWTHDPHGLDAEQRVAAASLYVALMTGTCLDILAAAGPTVLEGPLARNDLVCDALESLTGRPVHAASGSTGTSGGAAALLEPSGRPIRYWERSPSRLDPARFARYGATWRRGCLMPNAVGRT